MPDIRTKPSRLSGAVWFLLLWLAGFVGAVLLALPFHLLVAAAQDRL